MVLDKDINTSKEIGDVGTSSLNKDEVLMLMSQKNGVIGIRSTPIFKVERERQNGFFGDFIKLARPKCLDDKKMDWSGASDGLRDMVESVGKTGMDVFTIPNLTKKIIEETNFVDLYNEYLDNLVRSFINWTINKTDLNEEAICNDPKMMDILLENITAFELVKPKKPNSRNEEYLGFEKNSSGKVGADEIVDVVYLSAEDRVKLKEKFPENQYPINGRELVEGDIKEVVLKKVVSMIRRNLVENIGVK